MRQTITATEFKNSLGMYLDQVIDRHEIVITKNGKPAVRMSPYLTDYESYLALKEESTEYLKSNPKVTYDEFMQIYEKTDLRLEFLNGEILLLGSPTTDHQLFLGNLHAMLYTHLEGNPCRAFFAPFDVHFYKKGIKDPDVLQPDLVVACDLEGNVINGRYMGTPTLVIEVLSPDTRSRDMVDKLSSYMLSGVGEYWIVDPKNRQVLVYIFADCNINEVRTYHEGDTLVAASLSGFEASVSRIFTL